MRRRVLSDRQRIEKLVALGNGTDTDPDEYVEPVLFPRLDADAAPQKPLREVGRIRSGIEEEEIAP